MKQADSQVGREYSNEFLSCNKTKKHLEDYFIINMNIIWCHYRPREDWTLFLQKEASIGAKAWKHQQEQRSDKEYQRKPSVTPWLPS